MAVRPAKVLVVRDEERPDVSFAKGVIASLSSRPRISLVRDEAVELDKAQQLVDRIPDLALVVLIGFDDQTARIITSLRSIRPSLKFASFPVIGVHVSVNLPQPSSAGVVAVLDRPVLVATLDVELPTPDSPEFAEIVDLLVNGADSRVVQLYPPPARPKPGPSDPAVIANLFDKGLTWVELAITALKGVWSDDGRIDPMKMVSASWLEWMTSIADAAPEEADKAYADFMQALRHGDAERTPLHRVAALLAYDEIALKILLLALSSDLDIRFQRTFGSMQDDFGRRYPSVALACAIVAATVASKRPLDIRIALSRIDELRGYGIINGVAPQGIAPADTPLSVEAPVVDWLLTGDDQALFNDPAFAPLIAAAPESVSHLYPKERAELVAAAASDRLFTIREYNAVLLTGSEPGWIQADADILAECEIRLAPREGAEVAVGQLFQALRLSGRRVIVDLTEGGATAMSLWHALLPHLTPRRSPPLVLTNEPAALLAAAPRATMAAIYLPPVTSKDRADAISILTLSDDRTLIEDLSRQFRLPFDHLADALSLARAAADRNGRDSPNEDDWRSGFRAAAGAHLPALARRVEPDIEANSQPLDRVVLPERQHKQLAAIVSHVRYSPLVLDEWEFGKRLQARGVSALFSGDSGTGKTLAAHAIASELRADLYVVDLARIVSKYIGETEKNLDIVFNEAERAGAVLLFDEADALFGKRSEVKDAHDRYANIEVAYLLQRMELFDGLAILTTNHPDNVDPAFTRRLRFSVEFPRPDAAARYKIWNLAIPPDYREPEDLDLRFFANRLDVTGGTIRQIALHAAMAAAAEPGGEGITRQNIYDAAHDQLLRLGAHGQLNQLERAA